jgi:two-component system OmpR family response regulator
MVSILLIDDEPRICTCVARAMSAHGFEVESHSTPDAFMTAARARTHRALLIDWNLRTEEGTRLCRGLRLNGDERPIALTSGKLDTAHARRLAEECGADAYFAKPAIETWPTQLRDVLDRAEPRARLPSLILAGDVVIVPDYAAPLSPTEQKVVAFLLSEPGRQRGRLEIARHVWGLHSEPHTTLVDTVISRIRKRLGSEAHRIERTEEGWRVPCANEMPVEKGRK